MFFAISLALVTTMKHGGKGDLGESQAKSQQQRKKRKQDRTRSEPRNPCLVWVESSVLTWSWPLQWVSLFFLGFSNWKPHCLVTTPPNFSLHHEKPGRHREVDPLTYLHSFHAIFFVGYKGNPNDIPLQPVEVTMQTSQKAGPTLCELT